MSKYKYHEDGTSDPNKIFVFGSNLRGVHGAGAARYALDCMGASWGKGEGLTGKSYALPTKDARIETLPLGTILSHVDTFIEFAVRNPEIQFFVTRVGCGLAGYSDADIAPMFHGAPANCEFPIEWKEFLE